LARDFLCSAAYFDSRSLFLINRQRSTDDLPNQHAGERGYLLLGLLFLSVMILVGLALAAPKMAKEIQREKEVETVHRGEQYKRAIQLYYRKFGTYPTSMDQLKETSQIHFLRQDYIDPMTGKKDWKLLYQGQVQMVALGFFGQAMQGGGTPVGGMPGVGGATSGMPGATGMTGGVGGASPMGTSGGFGGSSSTTMTGGGLDSTSTSDNSFFNDSSNSSSGSSGNQPNGSPSATSMGGSQSAISDQSQQNSTDNASGSGQSGLSSGGMNSGGMFGSSSPTGGANGAPSVPGLPGSTPAGGPNGTSAAGGPIVGVTVPLKKTAILVYRKEKTYDKWQFVYNPMEEIAAAVGQGSGQTSGAGIGTPAGMSSPGQGGSSSPFGSSGTGMGSGSGGLGSSSGGMGSSGGGFGSSPSNSSGFGNSSGSGSNQTQSNPF
jgi:type II secretory pathway pseudopilin PulG